MIKTTFKNFYIQTESKITCGIYFMFQKRHSSIFLYNSVQNEPTLIIFTHTHTHSFNLIIFSTLNTEINWNWLVLICMSTTPEKCHCTTLKCRTFPRDQSYTYWKKIFNYDDSQDVSDLVRRLDGHLNVSTRQHLDHPSGGRCLGCLSQHPRLGCQHKHGTSMDEACSWTATSWILTTTELAGPSMSLASYCHPPPNSPLHQNITTSQQLIPDTEFKLAPAATHKDHVVVAIAVQNLVIINVVIL